MKELVRTLKSNGLHLLLVTAVVLAAVLMGIGAKISVAPDGDISIGIAGHAYAVTPDYTATGDEDDSLIQTVLDSLPSTGGSITLFAGSYDFHTTVSRAIDNVTISGTGAATIITTVGSAAPFDCTGQTGWVFSDFACDETPSYDKAYGVSSNTVVDGIWVLGTLVSDSPSPENVVRPFTLVIAASDSTASDKAAADYVCDGTSDQVEIQAAIDALPDDTGDTGGTGVIHLDAGTFYISDPIVVENTTNDGGKDFLTIEGSGRHSTFLRLSANFDAADYGMFYAPHKDDEGDMAQWGVFRDMGLFGAHTSYTGTASGFYGYFRRATFSELLIEEFDGHGIYLLGNVTAGSSVSGCKIFHVFSGWNELDGIYLDQSPDCWVTDSVVNGNRNGIVVNTSGTQINHIHFTGADNHGLYLGYDRDVSRTEVSGCYFDSQQQDGVHCGAYGIYYLVFTSNVVWASNASLGAYSQFNAGTATAFQYNTISNNTFDSQTYSTYNIDFGTLSSDAHAYNTICNNAFRRSPTVDIHDVYPSRTTVFYGNTGDAVADIVNSLPSEYRQYVSMQYKAAAGGDSTLAAGSIVVLRVTSGLDHGYEFQTTTTGGNDLVWGVLAEATDNSSWGRVQIAGAVTNLRVNGTDDIALGDFICTSTAHGVGVKAAAGDMCIAIALDPFSTDAEGTITALIISPRLI